MNLPISLEQRLFMESMIFKTEEEDWDIWPNPHEDADDVCKCPDHNEVRKIRLVELNERFI